MNVFRLTADFLHLFSIWYLFLMLLTKRSCGSLSGKTQLLFAIVYSARYLDLLSNASYNTSISAYLCTFKWTYIISYWMIVLMTFVIFKRTYRQTEDTFLTEFLLVPAFVLAVWFNNEMSHIEIMWTFSIYLEALAILPQFYMIYKQCYVEKRLIYYLVPLGLYRLFYVFNWIYRYYMENRFDLVADSAGLVYVFWYVCALIGFFILKIKVAEEGNNYLKKNIFLISGRESENPMAKHKKKATNEKLLPEEGLEAVQI